jgi:hypothetical protein
MRKTTPTITPPLAWSCTYPGRAGHVRDARRFLAAALDGCAVADDAILCLSELAANAVRFFLLSSRVVINALSIGR